MRLSVETAVLKKSTNSLVLYNPNPSEENYTVTNNDGLSKGIVFYPLDNKSYAEFIYFSGGRIKVTKPSAIKQCSIKIIADYLSIGTSNAKLELSSGTSSYNVGITEKVKENIGSWSSKVGISVNFLNGLIKYSIYSYDLDRYTYGEVISTLSNFDTITFSGDYINLYSLSVNENEPISDKAIENGVKNLFQIFADDGIGCLNTYRFIGNYSEKMESLYLGPYSKTELLSGNGKLSLPNLYIADNLNSDGNLDYDFNYITDTITKYSGYTESSSSDLDLTIKQYFSRCHNPYYYYVYYKDEETEIDKIYVSNIEYSGNAIIYVSSYISKYIKLAIPMGCSDEYIVKFGDDIVVFDTYGRATVEIPDDKESIVIDVTRGTDTFSFSVYAPNVLASSTIDLDYIDLTRWANYNLALGDVNKDHIIEDNSLSNTIAFLEDFVKSIQENLVEKFIEDPLGEIKETKSVANIAPKIYLNPICMTNTEKGINDILIERVATPFVNRISGNIRNLE